MTNLDRLFCFYMVVVGVIAGAILVLVPQSRDLAVKPFFWILIAAGVFDGAVIMRNRGMSGMMLSAGARIFGFIAGSLVLLAITVATGTTIAFF